MSESPLLVLDSCSALHLKQLTKAGHPALALIDALIDLFDVQLLCTPAVYGEQLEMTLRQKLNDWRLADRHRVESIRLQQRKELLNAVGKVKDMPGHNDVDLIALARLKRAALLTHDKKAAELARLLRIPTLDVIDLAGLLVELGGEDWKTQELRLGNLHTADWRASRLDWRGTVEATLTSRERWPRLLDHLKPRWLPPV